MKNLDSKQARFHMGQIEEKREQTEEYLAAQDGEEQGFAPTAWRREFRGARGVVQKQQADRLIRSRAKQQQEGDMGRSSAAEENGATERARDRQCFWTLE